MTKIVTVERTVQFGDCDPAGIAYTGKITDFCLEAIDAFWREVLEGQGWFEINVDHNIGTPFVNSNIDFFSPITPREKLVSQVKILKLGRTSIEFLVEGAQGGRPCYLGKFTCVFVQRDTVSKIEPPDWIRSALQPYLPGQDSAA